MVIFPRRGLDKMIRYVNVIAAVGAAICLGACAPAHSPAELAAARTKLEAYDAAHPLDAEKRKKIAALLYNSFGEARGHVVAAEISALKLDLDSIQAGRDIVRRPYYCVRTHSKGLLGLGGSQEWKVAVTEPAQGQPVVFTRASSQSGRVLACEMKVSYQPFPELVAYYPQDPR